MNATIRALLREHLERRQAEVAHLREMRVQQHDWLLGLDREIAAKSVEIDDIEAVLGTGATNLPHDEVVARS